MLDLELSIDLERQRNAATALGPVIDFVFPFVNRNEFDRNEEGLL